MERQVAYVALFAALIAALGLLPPIPMPFGVPITAQTLGVMLAGTVLGSKRGGLAVLLFVLLVLVGLPLLAGGRGGLGVVQSPTGGFFIGFPFAAFATGLVVEKWKGGNLFLVSTVAAILGGIILLYVFGISGLAIKLNKSFLEASVLVMAFIPGDIVKAVLAGFITQAIAKARPGSLLSRTQN